MASRGPDASALPGLAASRQREVAVRVQLIGDTGRIERHLSAPRDERAVGGLHNAHDAAREAGVEANQDLAAKVLPGLPRSFL